MVSTAQDIMDRYGIDQDFAASIESLGNDLGVDPMYLANTMYFESTLNPSEKNKAGSGAMGLIQFTPRTARNLGTTTDELSRMTPVEQMEYVRKYFSAENLGAGRLRDLRNDPSQHNVNMAVFLPSMIGKPVDTQIAQKYWQKNGSIRTPADYTRLVEKHVNNYIQSNPVDKQTDQMLSEEQSESTFRPEDDTVPSDTGTVTSDQAEEEPGFLDTVGEYLGDAVDTVGEYASDAYDTASEYVGETVDTLEGVAESVGEKLRRLLGLEEDQSSSSTGDTPPLPTRRPTVVDTPPLPTRRPTVVDTPPPSERRPVLTYTWPGPTVVNTPPLPKPRPNQTKKSSFNVMDGAGALYSLATTGSRESARKLRDMVAQQLGVYESSQEATSEAQNYGLNEREVDTLRHILGAGLLKYIGKDFTQPLLQGTELFEKIPSYAQRLLDPDSEDIYRKSYYNQSIDEANIDISNYQVGAALAKQYDTKDDFIKAAVKLVQDLGSGKTPVVIDKMPTRFGVVDRELTPRLSTGVVYPPEELKRKNLIYDPDMGTLTSPNPPLPERRPENLRKAEGGSVEKEVKFGKKDDDDDVPDPPPGATPEEVADDIPAYLSTGEYVLPANVVRYIGLKNITDMHRMALAELQQMEDLDIIENVDENGYVEDDDDETEYMEPEGVVEVIVAEHHPKGLMAMGFADGGPVEAMVYVPGVGFVPQTQAATQPVKTEEESTPISKLRESGEDPQSGIAEQEEGTEKISAEEASSRAQRGLLGFSPFSGVAAAVNEVVSNDRALSAAGISRDQFGNTTFGAPQEGPLGKSVASSIADIIGNPGVSGAVKDHISNSLSDEQMSEVLDSIESGFADQAAAEAGAAGKGLEAFGGPGRSVPDSYGSFGGGSGSGTGTGQSSGTGTGQSSGTGTGTGSGTGTGAPQGEHEGATDFRRGGYVTRNGIMAVGYSGGGEVGDPEGGPGEPPAEREPEPEVVEEEKPTDLYEGYTYVSGIGYVPTSRRMTSDKPVESASLDLYDDPSLIFTPSLIRTIYGLMSDPNKEV